MWKLIFRLAIDRSACRNGTRGRTWGCPYAVAIREFVTSSFLKNFPKKRFFVTVEVKTAQQPTEHTWRALSTERVFAEIRFHDHWTMNRTTTACGLSWRTHRLLGMLDREKVSFLPRRFALEIGGRLGSDIEKLIGGDS